MRGSWQEAILITTKFDDTRFFLTPFPLFHFQVILSVILTAGGVVIAALGDFSFDLFGYSLALISVFFQVG